MKPQKVKEIAVIGKRIREVRKYLQLQQKDMAQKLGITNAHLSEIENGTASPSIELLYKITRTYRMRLDYLFFGKGKMFYDAPGKKSPEKFTFDSSVNSREKLIWMLKKSDYFSLLVQGAASKIMIEEAGFIMNTLLQDNKNTDTES